MINRVTSLDEMPAAAPASDRFDSAFPRASHPDEERPGWFKQLETFVGSHPALALAAGAAVGIALGCLVKRR